MAYRPKGFGMTAELQRKNDEKYDPELEQQAVVWINDILGENALYGSGQDILHEALKSGVILCKVMNVLMPGKIKINESKMAFKMMENIGNFLSGCEEFGCAKTDMFQTVDLYENTNMPQVINGIHALGRKAGVKGFQGIGPKEASANRREFTEEQLKAGEGVIGLQMGSN